MNTVRTPPYIKSFGRVLLGTAVGIPIGVLILASARSYHSWSQAGSSVLKFAFAGVIGGATGALLNALGLKRQKKQ